MRISGTLVSVEAPRDARVTQMKAKLLSDNAGFEVPVYAVGHAARQLRSDFNVGDSVLLIGRLSFDPFSKQLEIIAQEIRSGDDEKPERPECTHRMNIQIGGHK